MGAELVLLAVGLLGNLVVVPLSATRALIAVSEGAVIEARWDGSAVWESVAEPAGGRYEVAERDSRWLGGELRAGAEFSRWDGGPPFEEWAPIPIDGGVLLMQTTEVTNRQYLAFLRATGRDLPCDPEFPGMRGYLENFPEHPAVRVGFSEARAYCRWRGRELGAVDGAEAPRLPSGAEWDRAAIGVRASGPPGGGGESIPGPRECGARGDDLSRWGVRDLGGNVAEWCADRADRVDPSAAVVRRLVRGGSWDRFADGSDDRGQPHFAIEQGRFSTVGFRPVWRIELPGEEGS